MKQSYVWEKTLKWSTLCEDVIFSQAYFGYKSDYKFFELLNIIIILFELLKALKHYFLGDKKDHELN